MSLLYVYVVGQGIKVPGRIIPLYNNGKILKTKFNFKKMRLEIYNINNEKFSHDNKKNAIQDNTDKEKCWEYIVAVLLIYVNNVLMAIIIMT